MHSEKFNVDVNNEEKYELIQLNSDTTMFPSFK